ncbi:N amino acid transport system protein [Vanrija pseudolonga]|uniref:N amino acid transport system protein n=1 Tax=Vanrija pseudolonga TaxID=143232 RepID=A0AAF1BJE4_9TREE|nr:N amino acid transport system protein [Vanrija pseudolonga]
MARVPGRKAAGNRDDGPIKAKTSRAGAGADEQSRLLVHAGDDYSTFSSASSSSSSSTSPPPPHPQPTMIKKDKDSVDVYEHDAHTAHHDVDVEDGKAGVVAPGVVTTDAVFGDITEEGPNYRGVSAWGAFILITKANLGLGILAIPFVFMSVGLVPGIILLCAVTALMIYTGSLIGPFKQRHPEIYSYADIGGLLFGRWGREIFGIIFTINFIFVTASAVVAVSTALNGVSAHAACTAVFIAVAAVLGWMACSIRTMGEISWLGWIGVVSILVSVLTVTVADRPSAAPPTGPWDKNFKVFAKADAITGISAITNSLFAFAATPTYFGIISEMRDPRQYQKVMIAGTTLCLALYLIIGSIVYHFCGQYVSSPALGSAGPLMKRVCYGIALPGLLVTLCIYSHLAAKYVFLRLLQGTDHLTRPTVRHWVTWLCTTASVMIVAYILASAIPSFGSIVGFIGSLFTPQTTVLVFPLIWWHDNWRYKERGARNVWMAVLNIFIFVCGLFFVVGGLYAAIKELIATKSTHGPWTCADNSGTVKSE